MAPGLATPGALLGCYALLAADRLPWVPAVMRLDTLTAPSTDRDSVPRRWQVARDAVTPDSARTGDRWERRRLWMRTWDVSPNDSTLRVRFSDGSTGTSFLFTLPPGHAARPLVGDTLVGIATAHSDVGPPFVRPAGRVTAVRVACPSVRGA